jgi:hypothetical protein
MYMIACSVQERLKVGVEEDMQQIGMFIQNVAGTASWWPAVVLSLLIPLAQVFGSGC